MIFKRQHTSRSFSFRRPWSPYLSDVHRQEWRLGWMDGVLLVVGLAGLVWFFWQARSITGYHWRWPLLVEFLVRIGPDGSWEPGLLVRGFFVTIRLGVWSMAAALVIGGILGMFSARRTGIFSFLVRCYVNLIRNTPPLVLLFLIYFFAGNLLPVTALEEMIRQLPPFFQALFGILFAPQGQVDRMVAAVLTLGLYEGAYVTEIVRGGLESVPTGQWEASAALGFSRFEQFRLVLLPQATQIILPPLVGQVISTFKDSTLGSFISLPELTFQSLEVMAISQMTFEIWLSTGVLYLLLGVVCARLGRYLETRQIWR